MLTERGLWLGATTAAIIILLLLMFQLRLEPRDAPKPRFDEGIPVHSTFVLRPRLA